MVDVSSPFFKSSLRPDPGGESLFSNYPFFFFFSCVQVHLTANAYVYSQTPADTVGDVVNRNLFFDLSQGHIYITTEKKVFFSLFLLLLSFLLFVFFPNTIRAKCIDTRCSRTGVCAHCTATAKQAYWLAFKTLRTRDWKQWAACVRMSTVAWCHLLAVIDVSVTRERKIKQVLDNIPPAQVSGSCDSRAEQLSDQRQSLEIACAAKSMLVLTPCCIKIKTLKSQKNYKTKQSVDVFWPKMQGSHLLLFPVPWFSPFCSDMLPWHDMYHNKTTKDVMHTYTLGARGLDTPSHSWL